VTRGAGQPCRLLLALALGGAALLGCASHTLSLRAGTYEVTPEDYEDVYRAWTREADAYAWDQLRDVLHITATLESPEFRWAYVVRYAHDYGLDTDARSEMIAASLADADANHRFFVTLAGDVYREGDLTKRDSAWRLLLGDGEGRPTPPSHLERVRRPSAAERVYFPSVSPFRYAYRVVFPIRRADGSPTIPPTAEAVTLRATGARGTVDLVWELETPSEPGADAR